MASPSIIQHKVKTTSHLILKKILEETYHAEPEDLKGTYTYMYMYVYVMQHSSNVHLHSVQDTVFLPQQWHETVPY